MVSAQRGVSGYVNSRRPGHHNKEKSGVRSSKRRGAGTNLGGGGGPSARQKRPVYTIRSALNLTTDFAKKTLRRDPKKTRKKRQGKKSFQEKERGLEGERRQISPKTHEEIGSESQWIAKPKGQRIKK